MVNTAVLFKVFIPCYLSMPVSAALPSTSGRTVTGASDSDRPLTRILQLKDSPGGQLFCPVIANHWAKELGCPALLRPTAIFEHIFLFIGHFAWTGVVYRRKRAAPMV